MFGVWPAALYDTRGGYVTCMTVPVERPFLVTPERRVYLKKCYVGHVLRFHEADLDIPNERQMVADIYRQMDDAGL